MDFKKQLLI